MLIFFSILSFVLLGFAVDILRDIRKSLKNLENLSGKIDLILLHLNDINLGVGEKGKSIKSDSLD